MTRELTMRGQIFAGYAEAIVARYGFGSNKMVHEWDNKRRDELDSLAQDLIDRCKWAKESFCIGASELEAALAGGKEGQRIWDEIADAENWLLENGYLRKYMATWERRRGRLYGHSINIGLTANGWAVARKYIDA